MYIFTHKHCVAIANALRLTIEQWADLCISSSFYVKRCETNSKFNSFIIISLTWLTKYLVSCNFYYFNLANDQLKQAIEDEFKQLVKQIAIIPSYYLKHI